jgi:predicted hydrocarbon binding protein
MRLARKMVRGTYGGSRAIVRWQSGAAVVDVRGSIFCGVRARADQPLCEYYVSAIHRLMALFSLQADVATAGCRATGAPQCLILIRPVRQ